MRKLAQAIVVQKVRSTTSPPQAALDELTEMLREDNVAESDVINVETSYHCRETDMFDHWYVTLTATYWKEG